MRPARAYLTGFGTAGSLLAGAALLFVLETAVVAFHGWPTASGMPPGPLVINAPIPASRAARRLEGAVRVVVPARSLAEPPAAQARRHRRPPARSAWLAARGDRAAQRVRRWLEEPNRVARRHAPQRPAGNATLDWDGAAAWGPSADGLTHHLRPGLWRPGAVDAAQGHRQGQPGRRRVTQGTGQTITQAGTTLGATVVGVTGTIGGSAPGGPGGSGGSGGLVSGVGQTSGQVISGTSATVGGLLGGA